MMRTRIQSRRGYLLLFLVLFLVPPALFADAVNITVWGGVDMFAFNQEQQVPYFLYEDDEPVAFVPSVYPIIHVELSGEFQGYVSWRLFYDRDALLRDSVTGEVGLSLGFFNLRVGPYLGIFNTTEVVVNPGVSVGLGLTWPGFFYFNADAALSVLSYAVDPGDYRQSSIKLEAGVWFPHIILSAGMTTLTYIVVPIDYLSIETTLTWLGGSLDFYSKNMPFVITLSGGSETLTRTIKNAEPAFQANNDPYPDEKLSAIVIGLGLEISFTPAFKLLVNGEYPIISATAPLLAPQSIALRAYAGFELTFWSKENRGQ
jgi:hypothetical protein